MKNHAQNDRGQPYGRNDELKGPLSSWRQTHPYGVGCLTFLAVALLAAASAIALLLA